MLRKSNEGVSLIAANMTVNDGAACRDKRKSQREKSAVRERHRRNRTGRKHGWRTRTARNGRFCDSDLLPSSSSVRGFRRRKRSSFRYGYCKENQVRSKATNRSGPAGGTIHFAAKGDLDDSRGTHPAARPPPERPLLSLPLFCGLRSWSDTVSCVGTRRFDIDLGRNSLGSNETPAVNVNSCS